VLLKKLLASHVKNRRPLSRREILIEGITSLTKYDQAIPKNRLHFFLASATALLALVLINLVRRYAVNILYWDQWDSCSPLFNKSNLWDVFSWPHGPHLQGIGLVVTRWVYDASGWNTIVESYYIVSLLAE
jgi:hypothetical protein